MKVTKLTLALMVTLLVLAASKDFHFAERLLFIEATIRDANSTADLLAIKGHLIALVARASSARQFLAISSLSQAVQRRTRMLGARQIDISSASKAEWSASTERITTTTGQPEATTEREVMATQQPIVETTLAVQVIKQAQQGTSPDDHNIRRSFWSPFSSSTHDWFPVLGDIFLLGGILLGLSLLFILLIELGLHVHSICTKKRLEQPPPTYDAVMQEDN